MSPNFKVLRLQGCEIGKLGVKHLKTILKLPNSRVEEIDLSYNMIQSDGAQELCRAFFETHEEFKTSKSSLQDLVRPDSSGELDEWDPSMPPPVITLKLACNNLEEVGIRNLCRALALPTTRIRHLSLSNNFLHYAGTKTLVAALIENTSLRKLELAQNFIKDEGAECLSFLLGLETCLLEEVDISDNFICTRGAHAIYSIFDNSTKTHEDDEEIETTG